MSIMSKPINFISTSINQFMGMMTVMNNFYLITKENVKEHPLLFSLLLFFVLIFTGLILFSQFIWIPMRNYYNRKMILLSFWSHFWLICILCFHMILTYSFRYTCIFIIWGIIDIFIFKYLFNFRKEVKSD